MSTESSKSFEICWKNCTYYVWLCFFSKRFFLLLFGENIIISRKFMQVPKIPNFMFSFFPSFTCIFFLEFWNIDISRCTFQKCFIWRMQKNLELGFKSLKTWTLYRKCKHIYSMRLEIYFGNLIIEFANKKLFLN